MSSADTQRVYTDPDDIKTVLQRVERGDELTVTAAHDRGGTEVYKDNREVEFVDYGGDIQFGEPTLDVGRVIRPETLTIYKLGDNPDAPLTNPLTITKVIVFDSDLFIE